MDKEGILYHHDKVLNQSVTQIVVPSNRRSSIMSFAHDNSFHQGHKKTSERIRYSFFWPTLRSDIIHHVATASLVSANVDWLLKIECQFRLSKDQVCPANIS